MPMQSSVALYQAGLVKLICSCQSGRSRSRAAYHLAAADAPAGALEIAGILAIVFLLYDCDARRGAAELNRSAAAHHCPLREQE
jgi:hypothetical protein